MVIKCIKGLRKCNDNKKQKGNKNTRIETVPFRLDKMRNLARYVQQKRLQTFLLKGCK